MLGCGEERLTTWGSVLESDSGRKVKVISGGLGERSWAAWVKCNEVV